VALSKYDIELDLARSPETSHAYIVDMVGSNKRVLDVGCDTGYLGETLTALGCRVSGVEYNPVTAAEAARKLERVVVGDLEVLDLVDEFGEGAFDVVVYGDVLEHLRDPLPVLRAARRLLAPGGTVVVSTPNIAHGDIRLALLRGQFRYTRLGILDETHTRFFTADSLMAFAGDAGMDVLELRRTRAPLFGTEQGLDPSDYPSELVSQLSTDNEATTYQFVALMAPQTAETRAADTARELDRVRAALAAANQELASLRDRCASLESERRMEQEAHAATFAAQTRDLRAELDASQAQVTLLSRSAAELRSELADTQRLIAAFERTKAVRAARVLHRLARR
jgi:2-polyprenyl-3-methyl-5-hydroxy-6-metoxy-1,4-benzoquinol methylase